jgi:hypothetical protein
MEQANEIIKVSVNWCFYVRFERRKWFKTLWWIREGNQFSLQIFNFMVGIGLPYHWRLVQCHLRDYKTTEFLDKATSTNRSGDAWFKMVFTKKYNIPKWN